MTDVRVPFEGADADTAELARTALQPVLDSMYRKHRREALQEIQEALRRAGRGTFARDGIEVFADHIARGDRPILIRDRNDRKSRQQDC
ncbi:hypothetical protein RQCS_58120 (plasmid) [Rhodococcus qingshengii]|nr:hypothetical protein RQCS_58120 [Rhodococcus qingshengii]